MMAAIERLFHSEGIRRYYGPTVEENKRTAFLNKRAPASLPGFYDDSHNHVPMAGATTLSFNPFDTAALHLRSLSDNPHHHHGFALIHDPLSASWDGAYYAVLPRNAAEAQQHASTRRHTRPLLPRRTHR